MLVFLSFDYISYFQQWVISIFNSFHVKKLSQNVQVATFHGDDSSVLPQDPKMPFQRVMLSLDFESASIFSHKIYLSVNSGGFHMLDTEKCCQKRKTFYCRVQHRMLHHTLYVGNHGGVQYRLMASTHRLTSYPGFLRCDVIELDTHKRKA